MIKIALVAIALLGGTPGVEEEIQQLIERYCSELRNIQSYKVKGHRISPRIQEMLDRDLPYCLPIHHHNTED